MESRSDKEISGRDPKVSDAATAFVENRIQEGFILSEIPGGFHHQGHESGRTTGDDRRQSGGGQGHGPGRTRQCLQGK